VAFTVKVRDVLTFLTQDGWQHKNTEGDHHHYIHPVKTGKVTLVGERGERRRPSGPAKLDIATGGLNPEGNVRMAEPLKYTVVIERSETGYGAYVPDLPGCGATGKTETEVRERIRAAIEIHLRSMREDGDPIPQPTSTAAIVEVAA
jgi:predicted RNase H-like HicB family nuclease/predicted RNA binding protein YcfA (HicA-like mRNA interferase family)